MYSHRSLVKDVYVILRHKSHYLRASFQHIIVPALATPRGIIDVQISANDDIVCAQLFCNLLNSLQVYR